MKRFISAVVALSLLGSTAAFAQNRGNGGQAQQGQTYQGQNYQAQGYQGQGYEQQDRRDNNNGAAVFGIGLLALAALAATQTQYHHHHWNDRRDYGRGYDRDRGFDRDDMYRGR